MLWRETVRQSFSQFIGSFRRSVNFFVVFVCYWGCFLVRTVLFCVHLSLFYHKSMFFNLFSTVSKLNCMSKKWNLCEIYRKIISVTIYWVFFRWLTYMYMYFLFFFFHFLFSVLFRLIVSIQMPMLKWIFIHILK